MIFIRDASKRFAAPEGGVIHALRDVSLDVGASEFITLLGPSGCGKTTLLRSVSGFEDLDEGTISIDDLEMTHVPPHHRPVNTVFQNYALFPHLTVANNIGYGLDVKGCARDERERRVGEAMALVGLSGFDRRKPGQLSGGQQQRVALARAIINRPRALLLDEPLSALDRKLREAMQLELKNIQNELGIAFVFVTHDQQEALTMSDRIVVMDHGQVQQIGPPTEVYDRPASAFVARFVGEGNLFTGELERDGETLALSMPGGVVIRTDAAGAPLQSGRAEVLVRPEDLEINPPGEVPPGFATLDIEVTQTIFVGTDFQVVARVAGDLPVKATIRDHSRKLSAQVVPGSNISLRYRLDAPRVLAPGPRG